MEETKTQEVKNAEIKKDVDFSFLPIFFDTVLRSSVYLLWKLRYLNNIWYWIIQVFVITIFTFVFMEIREDKFKEKYGEFNVVGNSWSLLSMFLLVIVTFYVNLNLYQWVFWLRIIFALIITLIYIFYLIVIYISSPKVKKSDEVQLGIDESSDIYKSDEIDIEIIRLQTNISYLNDRVDSYILESALFGALAFSGFLQIITSGSVSKTTVNGFINFVINLINSIILFNASEVRQNAVLLFSNKFVFEILSIESLFCTAFFLSVIASRLKFTDILEKIQLNITISESLKDRKNTVLQQLDNVNSSSCDKIEKQLEYFNKRILEEVKFARFKIGQIYSIIKYMRVFRTLGISIFLLMLISSSLLLNTTLTVVLSCLSILAFAYSNINHWLRSNNIKKLVISNTSKIKKHFK